MEQPACLFPSGLGVDHTGWSAPSDGGEVQPGQLVLPGPADEVARRRGGRRPGRWTATLPGRLAGRWPGCRSRAVSQSSRAMAALMFCCAATIWPWVAWVAAQPAAQPTDHVPDGVAVQQLLLARVGAFGDGPGDPAFQPGHLLIARRQRPGGDQDARRCSSGLAGGQFVEGRWVSGRWPGPRSRRIAGAVLLSSQPVTVAGRSYGGQVPDRGPAGPGRICPCSSPSSSRSRWPMVQRAHRPAWIRPGCPQPGQLRQNPGSGRVQAEQRGWALVPLRTGPVWPQPAQLGPALACRPRTTAGRWPWRPSTARVGRRSAGQRFDRQAGRAQRPVRGADADRAAPAAADAGLLVGRVGDQAVWAQRPAVLVAGGGLPHRSRTASRARPGTWPRSYGRAACPSIRGYRADNPAAARAGRPDDGLGAGVAELVDQPQHGRDGARVRLSPVSSPGWSSQGPGELVTLSRRRRRRGTAAATASAGSDGSSLVTTPVRMSSGIPVVVGRGTCAHRGRPCRSTHGGWPGLGRRPRTARACGPQAAQYQSWPAALQACAAACRTRRRPAARSPTAPALRKRDQQVPGGPGCRGAAVGQAPRAVRASAWASLRRLARPPGHAGHRRLGRRRSRAGSTPRDQVDDDADRVGQHVRDARRSSLSPPARVIRARFGAQARRPRPPSPLAVRALRAGPGGGGRLDQVLHRAVQDVQQRHQDLQAQPLGPLGDQPVDLAGRQPDPPLRPAARSGRWSANMSRLAMTCRRFHR